MSKVKASNTKAAPVPEPPKTGKPAPQAVDPKAAKGSPVKPTSTAFDPKKYAKQGVTEEEVTAIKTAFDLFDTDQGGSIDIKGNPYLI